MKVRLILACALALLLAMSFVPAGASNLLSGSPTPHVDPVIQSVYLPVIIHRHRTLWVIGTPFPTAPPEP